MKIGVIGGNGVAATNRLLDMVERKVTCSGGFRDAHHPEVIVAYETKAPSRSMFLEGKGESFIPDYIQTAKALKNLGCCKVCMCCNTAHFAIDELQREAGVEFINLLSLVAIRANNLGLNEVELWVTDGARKYDIYRKAFTKYAPNCKILYPDELRQEIITRIICSVKTKARFLSEFDKSHPHFLISELLKSAMAPVVLGCTDLRVAYKNGQELDDGVVIDSLECLADAIVSFAGISFKRN